MNCTKSGPTSTLLEKKKVKSSKTKLWLAPIQIILMFDESDDEDEEAPQLVEENDMDMEEDNGPIIDDDGFQMVQKEEDTGKD